MKKIEVYSLDEIPKAEKGMKYFACIGGSKNYECFYESDKLSRKEFMEKYLDLIDKCHIPVYEDNEIVITQDAQIPIPGFYIIATKKIYKKLCFMDLKIYQKCVKYQYKIKDILEKEFGINKVFMYYEEHYLKPSSTHFWVMPIYDDVIKKNNLNPTILEKDVWDYQDLFEFRNTKKDIYMINDKVREYMNRSD